MRQRFQIVLSLNQDSSEPLLRAREILGDFRSGQVIEARCSGLALYSTFERACSGQAYDPPVTAADVKWCTEVLLMNPALRGVRFIGVRELERKYTATERVNAILGPVEEKLALERALKN